jgi:hypothetical protein
MDLLAYLKSLPSEEARQAFAVRAGSTLGHVRNVAYGYKPCGPELAVSLERESARLVRRWDLRPHDWRRIWPELIGTDGAPVEITRRA